MNPTSIPRNYDSYKAEINAVESEMMPGKKPNEPQLYRLNTCKTRVQKALKDAKDRVQSVKEGKAEKEPEFGLKYKELLIEEASLGFLINRIDALINKGKQENTNAANNGRFNSIADAAIQGINAANNLPQDWKNELLQVFMNLFN